MDKFPIENISIRFSISLSINGNQNKLFLFGVCIEAIWVVKKQKTYLVGIFNAEQQKFYAKWKNIYSMSLKDL